MPDTGKPANSITIDAVETVPMTPREYDNAVAAFAALIANWNTHRNETRSTPSDNNAI